MIINIGILISDRTNCADIWSKPMGPRGFVPSGKYPELGNADRENTAPYS